MSSCIWSWRRRRRTFADSSESAASVYQLANTIVKQEPVGQAGAQIATTAEPCGFFDVVKR